MEHLEYDDTDEDLTVVVKSEDNVVFCSTNQTAIAVSCSGTYTCETCVCQYCQGIHILEAAGPQ